MRGRSFVGQRSVGREHVIGLGDLQRSVVHDREVGGNARDLRDVGLPLAVVVGAVHGHAKDLGVALLELGDEAGDGAIAVSDDHLLAALDVIGAGEGDGQAWLLGRR